jgi:hypothetical protein
MRSASGPSAQASTLRLSAAALNSAWCETKSEPGSFTWTTRTSFLSLRLPFFARFTPKNLLISI